MPTDKQIRDTRREKAGKMMADAICEFLHMMYNQSTARAVLRSIVAHLQKRLSEFE